MFTCKPVALSTLFTADDLGAARDPPAGHEAPEPVLPEADLHLFPYLPKGSIRVMPAERVRSQRLSEQTHRFQGKGPLFYTSASLAEKNKSPKMASGLSLYG